MHLAQEAAENLVRLVESAAGFAMEKAWHGWGPQIGRSTQGTCTDEEAEQKRPQQSAEAARADLASFLLAPNGNGEATSDGLVGRVQDTALHWAEELGASDDGEYRTRLLSSDNS
jgi:hypothetical protein